MSLTENGVKQLARPKASTRAKLLREFRPEAKLAAQPWGWHDLRRTDAILEQSAMNLIAYIGTPVA
jgi:hypothetical protein